MNRTFLCLRVTLVLAAACVNGQTIRIWGDSHMADVMKSLEDGFERHHPNARFETRLMGTGTSMAGLYTGVADLAFMGRAATPKEIMAFEWVFRYKPLSIDIMTGGLHVPGKSPALVVFVHKDNPISQLTLAQLDAIFGCERRRGLSQIRTWDQLGLKGDWTGKPIHGYVYDIETGSGSFFQHAALNDSRKWQWAIIKEFSDTRKTDAGRQILDALAADKYGIGVSCLCYRNDVVKPVALAVREGERYSEATTENLIGRRWEFRRYPLTRVISAYVNRAPDKPVDPNVKEFLRYLLSPEGQKVIAGEGSYLPLAEKSSREQILKLD